MLQVKVNFKSSAFPRCLHGRTPDHLGRLPPQRCRVVGPAVLRRPRAHQVGARGIRPSTLSACGPAADCLHRVRSEDWLDAGGDWRRARADPGKPPARSVGLGAHFQSMDAPGGRANRRAPTAARQSDRLHRLRLPVVAASASSPIPPIERAGSGRVRGTGSGTSDRGERARSAFNPGAHLRRRAGASAPAWAGQPSRVTWSRGTACHPRSNRSFRP